MYLIVNIIGLVVFLSLGVLFSKNRQQIKWKSVGIMVVFNLVLAWFLTSFPIGRSIVAGASAGFNQLVQVAYQGIAFALADWVDVKSMNFVTSSLLPILMIIPLFDILTYVGILPWIIITNMLNPVTVTPEEDTIATMAGSGSSASAQDVGSGSETLAEATVAEDEVPTREPFFSFLGDSILNAGKLVLIITANVIAFVALAALVDKLLGIINPWLTLEHILGIVMFPFAWLTGLNVHDAFEFAQYMGTKLVTNEFVVMGKVTGTINQFAPHYKAVLTVFLTSFANFSTVGMIIGCFKGLVNRQKNDVVAKNVGYLLLSGILVSLVSAATVGLFVW